MKKALILGVTGQDGSYLADFLLKHGNYEVFGSHRRTSHKLFERLEELDILYKFDLVKLDVNDQISINKAMKEIQPDEVYNLAAQSFVGVSFGQPILTTNVTGLGALRVFEAVKEYCPDAKVYQASSSEMFGNSNEKKNELTRLYPESPYGIAKVFAHKTAQHYRKAYNMFISCGILFNHESPLRGIEFVTRKITYNIARIMAKKKTHFSLGNVQAKRDWGYAPEYVKVMWMMLQQNLPSDYVVSTGESHSVEEFLSDAFEYAGLGDWESYVDVGNKTDLRPSDIDNLVGDSTKAKTELKWEAKTKYKELVKIMVDSDLKSFGLK